MMGSVNVHVHTHGHTHTHARTYIHGIEPSDIYYTIQEEFIGPPLIKVFSELYICPLNLHYTLSNFQVEVAKINVNLLSSTFLPINKTTIANSSFSVKNFM